MDRIELNAKISARILYYRAQGVPVRQAIDWVLGVGTCEALIEELYHELRGEAV
jgi:hypothetical protein